MTKIVPPRGPLHVRILIGILSVAFGLLVYWLLGFLVGDIGTAPGPDYAELEASQLDRTVVAEQQRLQEAIVEIQRQIQDQQGRQRLLQEIKNGSQQTIQQLGEIQRLQLERDVTPAPAAQEALAAAQTRFLENDQQIQQISDELLEMNRKLVTQEDQRRQVDERLMALRQPIQQEYARLTERHNWKMGMLKLALLVPVLMASAVTYRWTRRGPYSLMVLAVVLAAAVKIFAVMNSYFPDRFFKYILIGTLILVVARALSYLLHARAHPQPSSLLKQYREAYEAFLCPVCEYPIRRGPWKFLAWTRRTVRQLVPPIISSGHEPVEDVYVCPVCATPLYGKCDSCQDVRPVLLPACPHCGKEYVVGVGEKAT